MECTMGIQTYYKGSNELQLYENVMQFLLQAYQGKKEVIKNTDDYSEQIIKIKAFNIDQVPKRRYLKDAKLVYHSQYTGLIEVLPYLKGCFGILDNK